MAYPQQLPLDGWREPALHALWQAMSPDIKSGAIDAADTYTVYGTTFTVGSIGTGPSPVITVTDPNGIGYSFPAYAVPNDSLGDSITPTVASPPFYYDYIPSNEKGAANGIASLDSGGHVPASQLSADTDAFIPLSTVTTIGDLVVGTGAGAVTRIAGGTTGQVLTGATGSEPSFQDLPADSDAFIPLATVTTIGDLIVGTGAGAVTRIAGGTTGQVLTGVTGGESSFQDPDITPTATAAAATLGAAAQLAQTTNDSMLYIVVGTAGTLTVAIGAANSVTTVIVNGVTAVAGSLYTVRLPAAWYIAVTSGDTAAWTTTALTC